MSLSGKPFDEKRDFIRMRIETPLEATLTGDGGTYKGICRELSGGGMQLELDDELAQDSEWEINIASNHGHSPQLRAVVKVVRVLPQGERFATGMQIIEVID